MGSQKRFNNIFKPNKLSAGSTFTHSDEASSRQILSVGDYVLKKREKIMTAKKKGKNNTHNTEAH